MLLITLCWFSPFPSSSSSSSSSSLPLLPPPILTATTATLCASFNLRQSVIFWTNKGGFTSVRYVGILGQAKLSGSQPKSLDRTQVCYACDAGIEPESIPTYKVLRTRR